MLRWRRRSAGRRSWTKKQRDREERWQKEDERRAAQLDRETERRRKQIDRDMRAHKSDAEKGVAEAQRAKKSLSGQVDALKKQKNSLQQTVSKLRGEVSEVEAKRHQHLAAVQVGQAARRRIEDAVRAVVELVPQAGAADGQANAEDPQAPSTPAQEQVHGDGAATAAANRGALPLARYSEAMSRLIGLLVKDACTPECDIDVSLFTAPCLRQALSGSVESASAE